MSGTGESRTTAVAMREGGEKIPKIPSRTKKNPSESDEKNPSELNQKNPSESNQKMSDTIRAIREKKPSDQGKKIRPR